MQQNLGAVLRSAAFLGAAGVLTCARNSAPLSPAVSKASAGALESLTVHSCEAMQKTLERARADGWAVLGTHSVLRNSGGSGVGCQISCAVYALGLAWLLCKADELECMVMTCHAARRRVSVP